MLFQSNRLPCEWLCSHMRVVIDHIELMSEPGIEITTLASSRAEYLEAPRRLEITFHAA